MKDLVLTKISYEKTRGMWEKAARFWNKYSMYITLALVVLIMVHGTVFASAGADSLWSTLSNEIKKWVTRLGGVIMFGLGWKSDDAEQRSRGVNTMIAGGIVIAIAQLTGTFFA